MKKGFLTFFTAVLTATILTGCGGGYSNSYARKDASDDYFISTESYSPDYNGGWYEDYDMYNNAPAAQYGSTKTDSANTITKTDSADVQDSGRKLIKRVNLSVQTLEYDKGCSLLEGLVAQNAGYIENSSSSNYTYYGSRNNRYANYTVRIPSGNLDAFLSSLGGIGTIYNQSMSTEDVTLSYLDVEARSKALRIQQERLLALLEKAETVEEIIALEDRISDVTYQLEAQESMLKNYDNLVTYSTITISIEEVTRITETAPETVGERIVSGLSDTFYTIGEGFKDFSVWFVVNLPFIILWLIIIAIVIILLRLIIKSWKNGKEKRIAKRQAKKAAADAKKQAALQAKWAKEHPEQNNAGNQQ